MPPLSSTSVLDALMERDAAATNDTSNALQVICAWPVSGQYGPGSRGLYYVLIAACVFARREKWLRSACLAAALLFPIVAALHGIVLAAVHVDGAVDMDIYGAFQLCSIGILAAPVTVRLSRTYFYDPGRNIIFVWTGFILAGLLSLTVEFFRVDASDCTQDSGNPISSDPGDFPYGALCSLNCSVDYGPFSPLRGGSANNIYVIPVPDKLTFDTATLIAAACCIPAILSLISMWNKILQINWKKRFGDRSKDERVDEPIEGTNGATIETMRGINSLIRSFLNAVEIPVFGAAVLAILAVGEMNFFSAQVQYQTEPIASIGQWAPIVGTGLALLGSLYLLLSADTETVKGEVRPNGTVQYCNCPVPRVAMGPFTAPSYPGAILDPAESRRGLSNGGERASSEIVPTTSASAPGEGHQHDVGNRRRVAGFLTAIINHLGTAADDRYDDSEFKNGKALDFPEIPGEEHRNSALGQIRERYNQVREASGNVTPYEQHSRAGSAAGSITSRLSGEGRSTTPRVVSSQSPQPREASSQSPQPPHSLSSFPRSIIPRRSHDSMSPAERGSFELHDPPSSASTALTRGRSRQQGGMLEVPSHAHHNHTRNSPSASPIASIGAMTEVQRSPTIVVSSDPGTSSPAR